MVARACLIILEFIQCLLVGSASLLHRLSQLLPANNNHHLRLSIYSRHALTISISLAFALALAFHPSSALATPSEYQNCVIGDTCTLGEFYYTDNVTPISGASCTLTTRNPSNTTIINAAAMTDNGDGWYSYDIDTTGYSQGIYPSQMCCTYSGETICIDKTFKAVPADLTSQDIETAVWSSPNRTLTSFGTLIEDIWSYSSRSLTSFGNLISNIWSSPDNTLNSQADLSNEAINNIANEVSSAIENSQTLSDIQTDINSIQNLLEQITFNTNTNTINFNQTSNGGEQLGSLLEQTRSNLNQLYAKLAQLQSQIGLTTLNWDTLSASDIQSQLNLIARSLGTDPNQPDYESSLTNLTNWLNHTWNNDLTNSVQLDISTASNLIDQLQNHANFSPADLTDLNTVLTALESAADNVGDLSSTTDSNTLFGMLKRLDNVSKTLSQADQELTDLINSWDQYATSEIENKLNSLQQNILAVDILPNSNEIISSNGVTTQDKLKNLALSLKALITGNQLALASNGLDPISVVWLESGTNTVVFRSYVYNPSSASQIVPLSYNLPKELTDQDIIELPQNLEAKYDSTNELYVIGGQLNLDPGSLITQSTVTRDFWYLSPEEIQNLKQQASDLLSGLEGTNYYTEAAGIKSEIDVTLDQILKAQQKAVTPDDRIAYFRSAQTQLSNVKGDIGRLKSLVDEAANSGSLMGFVGGVQAVAVWGIIVIVIAGFIFLTIYMRMLYQKDLGLHHPQPAPVEERSAIPTATISPLTSILNISDKRKPFPKQSEMIDPAQRLFQILVIILSTSILVILVVGTILETTQKSQSISQAPQSYQTAP